MSSATSAPGVVELERPADSEQEEHDRPWIVVVGVGLLFQVIQSLRDQGHTIIIVEQSVHHVLRIADRAYVLSHGELVLSGRADELAEQRDLLASSYLGVVS